MDTLKDAQSALENTSYGAVSGGLDSSKSVPGGVRAPRSPFIKIGEFNCYREFCVLREIPQGSPVYSKYLVEKQGKYYSLILSDREAPVDEHYLKQLHDMARLGHGLLSVPFEMGYDVPVAKFYKIEEYLPLGSFREYLEGRFFDESTFLRTVQCLAESVGFLHEHDVVHGGINPKNIFIRGENPLHLTLSNIPIMRSVILNNSIFPKTPYELPYVLSGEGGISREGDWWSVGAVLLECLVHPSERAVVINALQEGKNIDLTSLAPKEQRLISSLLEADPLKRWGKKEILRWCCGELSLCAPLSEVSTVSKTIHPQPSIGEEAMGTPETLAQAFPDPQEGASHLERAFPETSDLSQTMRASQSQKAELHKGETPSIFSSTLRSGEQVLFRDFPSLEPILETLSPHIGAEPVMPNIQAMELQTPPSEIAGLDRMLFDREDLANPVQIESTSHDVSFPQENDPTGSLIVEDNFIEQDLPLKGVVLLKEENQKGEEPLLPPVHERACEDKVTTPTQVSFSDWPLDLQDLLPVRASTLAHSTTVTAEPSGLFYFGSHSFSSLEQIAFAFAKDEASWELGRTQIEKLQIWLESRGQISEAEMLLKMRSITTNMDEVLFRFVHTFAALPFTYLGKKVDMHELYHCLEKMVTRKGTDAERSILSMLNDGQLAQLYDEYARLRGNKDDVFVDLLQFLQDKPPSEQWVYLGALVDPKGYIWPEENAFETTPEVLGVLKAIGTIPISRAFIKETQEKFTLPENILSLLDDVASYAIGAMRLRDLFARNQPIDESLPTEDFFEGSPDDVSRSIKDDTQSAATLLFGKTPGSMEKIEGALRLIEEVVGDMGTELKSHEVFQLGNASSLLRQLKEKELSPREDVFLTQIDKITAEYDRFDGNLNAIRLAFLCVGGIIAGVLAFFLGDAPSFLAIQMFLFTSSVAILCKKLIALCLSDDFEWVSNIGGIIYLPILFVAVPLAWWAVYGLSPALGIPSEFVSVLIGGAVSLSPLSDCFIKHKKRSIVGELCLLCVEGAKLST